MFRLTFENFNKKILQIFKALLESQSIFAWKKDRRCFDIFIWCLSFFISDYK